ncbi:MAG: hypothetical protein WBD28_00040, partial [Candidatus Zixiibacteriota bacterium]
VLYFKQDNFLVKKVVSFLESTGVYFPVEVLKTIQYRFAIGILICVMILGLIIFIKVPDRFKREIR